MCPSMRHLFEDDVTYRTRFVVAIYLLQDLILLIGVIFKNVARFEEIIFSKKLYSSLILIYKTLHYTILSMWSVTNIL